MICGNPAARGSPCEIIDNLNLYTIDIAEPARGKVPAYIQTIHGLHVLIVRLNIFIDKDTTKRTVGSQACLHCVERCFPDWEQQFYNGPIISDHSSKNYREHGKIQQ